MNLFKKHLQHILIIQIFFPILQDFENRNNREKKYCDECNELYLLTNDIFEKYINKIKIPYNIKYYEKGYKNKVLYFLILVI